ncbi:MAG: hypothetical protein ACLQF0_04505 [Dissulfurispiraceae bacterium]
MKKKMQFFGGVFVLVFALSFVIFGSASAADVKQMQSNSYIAMHEVGAEEMKDMSDMKGMNMDMDMHHMHIMMDHGLSMVTEGSSLVMLGEMKMAPSLDPMTMEHGRHMMAEGKKLIEHEMSGSMMKSMHKAGHGNDPLMKYTHELGNAMMDYVNIVDSMGMKGEMADDMMTMHHMHILINHAVNMAVEGANLVMLGQMHMAKGVDKGSVEHGKMMISDADKLLSEVMKGKAMMEMHEKGIKMNNEMMAYTHKLGAAAQKLVDLLSGMPK